MNEGGGDRGEPPTTRKGVRGGILLRYSSHLARWLEVSWSGRGEQRGVGLQVRRGAAGVPPSAFRGLSWLRPRLPHRRGGAGPRRPRGGERAARGAGEEPVERKGAQHRGLFAAEAGAPAEAQHHS